MIQAKCQLIEKKQIKKDIHLFIFENAVIAAKTKPGQFIHLNVGPGSVVRHPFSVFDTSKDTFSILFQVVGDGTRRLSTYRAGQYIDVIGSLGHGFLLEAKAPLMVGGGIGVASLNLLNKHFVENEIKPNVVLGFRNEDVVVDWPNAQIATEDGSVGVRGKVTDLMEKEIDNCDVVYACGPEAMLKEVDAIARKKDKLAYVCLEKYMACGVGACLSCVCETKYGYARVCKDGPVFNSKDIIW